MSNCNAVMFECWKQGFFHAANDSFLTQLTKSVMFCCRINDFVSEISSSDDSLVVVALLLFLSFSSTFEVFLVSETGDPKIKNPSFPNRSRTNSVHKRRYYRPLSSP